jgi:hypothetical protein
VEGKMKTEIIEGGRRKVESKAEERKEWRWKFMRENRK